MYGDEEVAIQSFYEDMMLDTPAKVRNLENAFELAEKRGPLVFTEPRCKYDDS